MKDFFSSQKYVILFIILIILSFVLHFYKLSEVPHGFSQDESAIGYNAYSINKTLRDENGTFMPLYFKSFGDYKLPVYVYLTSGALQIFGTNEFAVRFPSAFFGALSILVLLFLVLEISKRKDLAFLSAFLFLFTPWHLHFSRSAFEVNVALFFMMLCYLLFLKALRYKNNFWLFLCCLLCFSLSLYSYNVTRLLSPLLFTSFILLHLKECRKISRIKIFSLLGFLILFLLPLLMTIFSKEGAASAKEALLIGSQAQAKIVDVSSNFGTMPIFIRHVAFNKWVLTAWQYVQNIFAYFSVSFFFTNGSQHGNQGIGNSGVLLFFELPLLIVGFYIFVKQKVRYLVPFFVWGVVTLLVVSLSVDAPHATRGYFLVMPLTVFASYGGIFLFSKLKIMKKNLRVAFFMISIFFIGYSLLYYIASYFYRFPVTYSKQWHSADKELSLFLLVNHDKYDKVVIDSDSGLIYTSILFFQQYSPVKFQKEAIYDADNKVGYRVIKRFDSYEYKKIDWAKVNDTGRILYVTGDTNQPVNKKSVRAFVYPKRVVAFSADGEVILYPASEVAYRLYE